MNSKKLQIVKGPYIFENAFKNDNGDLIEYAQLSVDVKVGDTIVRLSAKLRGFEKEYIKDLLSAENAFNNNDIMVD